ncbi:hypothetical protein [Roseisolibacter sp. H3M3-2]|uniref:methyltransferase family protein n=1 Tax=Roseisolibacter sp. H3M3-2 TaxID=3031323 RepID=UPI0023DC5685|nr:hypothetical protein [Roseisolibacter sp. H3M3-2]
MLHSALADRRAKEAFARRFGTRARDAWYRPLFNAQAVVATAALAAWAWRQPDRTLYATRGPLRALLRVGQLAGLALGASALREAGVARFAGVPGAWDWVRGAPVRPPMEAQGPTDRDDGVLRTGGAFARVRHPLNTAFAVVLWCSPRMTVNLAAVSAVSTIYLLVGSVREEQRLLQRHGDAYEAYRGGRPFLVPLLSNYQENG